MFDGGRVGYAAHAMSNYLAVIDGTTEFLQAALAGHDEGPGLSPADQARLYQRGVRLSATPTAGEPSTGFGLAVARDLVMRNGGDLRCESREGAGACFSIHLPLVGQSSPETAPSRGRFTIPIRTGGA